MPLTRDQQKELHIKNKLEKPNTATYASSHRLFRCVTTHNNRRRKICERPEIRPPKTETTTDVHNGAS